MSGLLNNMWSLIWGLLKYPLIILAGLSIFFFGLVFVHIGVLYLKGARRPKLKGKRKNLKRGVLLRLFYDLPRRIAKDFMDSDPNDFPYKGMIIFTGRQGNGKTIALVDTIRKMQASFPCCKVITNLAYANEDDELNHWQKLTDYNNGKEGVVCGLDETQNWFSSSQSKNFPPEMLAVVTQNRKNHRIILGTAQNFYLLSKAIRTQTTEIRSCITLFGCLTIVKRSEPLLDFEGNVQELKTKGYYFFVHDDNLRSSYDTYRVIENLSGSGFVNKQKSYVQ